MKFCESRLYKQCSSLFDLTPTTILLPGAVILNGGESAVVMLCADLLIPVKTDEHIPQLGFINNHHNDFDVSVFSRTRVSPGVPREKSYSFHRRGHR